MINTFVRIMLPINFLRTFESIGKRSTDINRKASNMELSMKFSFFIVIFVVHNGLIWCRVPTMNA